MNVRTAVFFLGIAPSIAMAQSATPVPTIEQAAANALMLFCVPLVAKEATNSDEIARFSKYQPTPLPNTSGLKVRSAPAWLAPSASGRVVVSRGGANERVPLGCEITVSGSSGAQLSKKLSEMLICDKCPFVRNAQFSRQQNGVSFEKYDWAMPEKKALLSVLTVAFPGDAAGVNFFAHIYMVR